MSSPETTDQVTDALAKMRTDEGYFAYGAIAWDGLGPDLREQLRQLLFQGPVWDGFIISKHARMWTWPPTLRDHLALGHSIGGRAPVTQLSADQAVRPGR